MDTKRAVALALVIACGGGGGAAPTTATPPVTTTTETGAPTTNASETTTTLLGFVVADPGIPPAPLFGSNDALGSGCTPGEGTLPDGIWFGFVTAKADEAVEFDLACWFGGDAANQAAAADGVEEIPVPNDYYIRNENPTSRTVPVSPSAVVHSLGETIEEFEHVGLEQWSLASGSSLACSHESCLVWLYLNGGSVTEIVEQYTP